MSAYVTQDKFPLVGVGASAGGVESFQKFLKAIPANSGMAYILVQHLSPTHESILYEILSRSTTIPVQEIVDDCRIEPDHIYVIPENKMLEVTGYSLKLTPRKINALNMPIDIFFTSLAREHGSLAIGVVLSGNANDGTVGLRNIREHGGITFAEDPGFAAWDGMPKNAIQAGVVDFVLPVEEIPAKLSNVHALYETDHAGKDGEKSKSKENLLTKILSIIQQHSGVDFSYYRQPTILRRINRRMAINQFTGYEDYLEYLSENKSEQESLFQDFLIKVTSFFRNPEIFEELGKKVFPSLLDDRAPNKPIRIWIPACSTGEEAYSLAIGLFDSLGGLTAGYNLYRTKIQIFASDISRKAINEARNGIFSPVEIESLSEWQLEDYFIRTDGGYQVVKPIRDTIIFTVHNLLKDPPFGKVDLISCRNMLIYLDPVMQRKALSTFHYALNENGFLLLGKSETIDTSSDLFSPFSQKAKIFSRKPGSGRFLPFSAEQNKKRTESIRNPAPSFSRYNTDFRKSADAVMVSKYNPPSVIVNQHFEIAHINGSVAPFLEPSTGKPTHKLLKMAGKELAFELRKALQKARDSQETVVKKGIPIKFSEERLLANIEVVPLIDVPDPHYLIVFRKKSLQTSFLKRTWKKLSPTFVSSEKSNAQWRMKALERELEQARDDIRDLNEEQEAYTEEVQSANEELLSSNEEMQSLNAELETSRQELQSANEELIVVNRELLEKQDEQNKMMNYLDAVISNLREPLVVLEKDFRIKTANASYYKKFDVGKTETVGRLFFEVQDGMWENPNVRSLLQKVLPQKKSIVDQKILIKSPSGVERSFMLNAKEMKMLENEDSGSILLSIDDIKEKKYVRKS